MKEGRGVVGNINKFIPLSPPASFDHELPSGLSLRVEDKTEWEGRGVGKMLSLHTRRFGGHTPKSPLSAFAKATADTVEGTFDGLLAMTGKK